MVTAVAGVTGAQTSASYRLEQRVFNAGGRPADGVIATSAGFRITLDSLGEPLLQSGASSASFSMTGGFLPAYMPPGEAMNVRFVDKSTLDWDAHPAAHVYQLYRGGVSSLSGVFAGSCEQPDLPSSTATVAGTPSTGEARFYLVTVKNRLGEEGTRGTDGSGAERSDSGVCP
jgi:hypothetical protein